MSDDELVEVVFLRLPVRWRALSLQHGEELLRELTLIQLGTEQGEATSAPRHLLDLAAELQGTYGPLVQRYAEQVEAAGARGEDYLDHTAAMPRSTGAFLRRVERTLDAVEAYCREGKHLLTLVPPEGVRAYREWTFNEVQRQLAGEAPAPWREPDERSGPPS